jgi:hypothetical protein
MSFSRLLRKFSQSNLARPASADAASSPSPHASDKPPQRRQASEPMPLVPRPWRRKRRSTAGHSSISLPTSTSPPATPKAESHASVGGSCEMPVPMPLPVPSSVSLLNLSVAPPPEVTPATGPVPDKLAEAWDAVKEDPRIAKTSRELDAIGTSSTHGLPFFHCKLTLKFR